MSARTGAPGTLALEVDPGTKMPEAPKCGNQMCPCPSRDGEDRFCSDACQAAEQLELSRPCVCGHIECV